MLRFFIIKTRSDIEKLYSSEVMVSLKRFEEKSFYYAGDDFPEIYLLGYQ